MTTQTLYPNAPGQDATWVEGLSALDTTATNMAFGYGGSPYLSINAFARFIFSATIPQGSTINEAFIRFYANLTLSATCRVAISAIDAANPLAPTTYAGAEGATRTTAFVLWTVPAMTIGTQYSSPDIASVLQELADSYDIVSVVVYLEDNIGSGGNSRQVRSYDYGSQYPELYVDYTAPAGGPALSRGLSNLPSGIVAGGGGGHSGLHPIEYGYTS